MSRLAEFEEILKRNEPLAPYTYLKLGGPAEMLAQPRSHEELSALVQRCYKERIPFRVLGSGCNLIVRDEGVEGVVLRLSEPVFAEVVVERKRVGGAEVSDRDASYFVVHPGASARDALRLIDLVRSQVKDRFNVELEQE